MIIVSQPRSGTHMVRTALNRHPKLKVATEIFNGLANPKLPREYSALQGQVKVAQELVARNKHFTIHLYDPHDLPGLWPGWQAQVVLQRRHLPTTVSPMLFLYRKNKLRQAISRLEAEMSGHFDQYKYKQNQGTLRCPPWLMIEQIRIFQRADKEAKRVQEQAASRGVWTHRVSYEELRADWDAQMKKIQTGAGVSPKQLTPATLKQGDRPMSERVRNWKQLVDAFRETDYWNFVQEIIDDES